MRDETSEGLREPGRGGRLLGGDAGSPSGKVEQRRFELPPHRGAGDATSTRRGSGWARASLRASEWDYERLRSCGSSIVAGHVRVGCSERRHELANAAIRILRAFLRL